MLIWRCLPPSLRPTVANRALTAKMFTPNAWLRSRAPTSGSRPKCFRCSRGRRERHGADQPAAPVGAVIATSTAHLHTDENGAPERIGGLEPLTVDTLDGKLTPELIDRQAWGWGDEHRAQPPLLRLGPRGRRGALDDRFRHDGGRLSTRSSARSARNSGVDDPWRNPSAPLHRTRSIDFTVSVAVRPQRCCSSPALPFVPSAAVRPQHCCSSPALPFVPKIIAVRATNYYGS
jgi:hypothetical protein